MSDILKPIIENYTTKLANELSRIRWDILTPKYKNFLQQIPLSLYREKLPHQSRKRISRHWRTFSRGRVGYTLRANALRAFWHTWRTFSSHF